jgi:Lrp/AsnC family transcriptional regulator of lysine biosynthesis
MDEKDYKIIKILEKDSQTSFVEIAERLNVSEGTIRYRVNRMLRDSNIKFTVKHRAVEGLIFIKGKNIRNIVNQLKQFSDSIYEISGDYDIAAIIDAPTINELNKKIDRIRAIKGIVDTNTAISLVKR